MRGPVMLGQGQLFDLSDLMFGTPRAVSSVCLAAVGRLVEDIRVVGDLL